MNNKNTTLKILIVALIILLIRYIGIEHMPPLLILLIFLSTVIYLIYKITLNNKRQIKDTYYLVFACLFIAFETNAMIMFLIQNEFPRYMIIVKPIILPAFAIIFISLIIHVYFWAIMSNKKR